ncbi:membrane protein of unknown function [Candidatus Hydrogenisulfobacillus filiaventi]|uniref:Uncharacterized protein n=1 Tax=Candidatus Hydrogenisulfobacillus filiaventi TaxID=2707344 RepID=A0A6F8ZDL2_9FIRM|nr:hypothetical protein [Bacillota bacterium]CAB1127542.1 membrane protein of unknown function [Candidatus Hydrogenisulfobacillus filiaventi]
MAGNAAWARAVAAHPWAWQTVDHVYVPNLLALLWIVLGAGLVTGLAAYMLAWVNAVEAEAEGRGLPPARPFLAVWRPGGRVPSPRRPVAGLMRGLGVAWLLQALLAAQPRIPSPATWALALAPRWRLWPHWLAGPLAGVAGLWRVHPAGLALLLLLLDVIVGLLLLWAPSGPRGRMVLAGAGLWGLGVSVLQLELGTLLRTGAGLAAGFGGAALVWALAAVALLAPDPRRAWRRMVAGVWGLAAGWQLVPVGGHYAAGVLSGLSPWGWGWGHPGPLAAWAAAVAGVWAAHPVAANLMVAGSGLALAGALWRSGHPALVWVAAVWLALWGAWTHGWGDLATGLALDPGGAMALALMLGMWLLDGRRRRGPARAPVLDLAPLRAERPADRRRSGD